MRKRAAGVTLVDFMVVVALAGIVAAVMLTNILRHEARGKMCEAIQVAAPGKAAIEAYFLAHGHIPDAGLVRLDAQASQWPPSLTWNGVALIVMVGEMVGGIGISDSVVLRPIVVGRQLVWVCRATNPATYLPENC